MLLKQKLNSLNKKMKVKKAQTNWVKGLFWLPHYSHFTVSAIIQIHLIVGLKFYICQMYIVQLQIFQKNWYFSQLLCSYVIALCVWRTCVRRCAFWTKFVKFSGESASKSSCTYDSEKNIFPWLSNIYRWRIYLWNVHSIAMNSI